MCEAIYKHFAKLFGRGGTPYNVVALRDSLAARPRLSARQAECCEGPITAVEEIKVLSECSGARSPRHDGLIHEFYRSMPDFLRYLLADVYVNSLQNGIIP